MRYLCLLLMLGCAYSVPVSAPAEGLNSTLELLRSRQFKGPRDPIVETDIYGNTHAVFFDKRSIGYMKVKPDGGLAFPVLYIQQKHLLDGIGLALCRGNGVVMWIPVHESPRFALIDQSGVVADSGELSASVGVRPKTFLSPDSNAVVWGYYREAENIDTRYNLPVLVQHGNVRLFVLTRLTGASHAGSSGFHMLGDSNVYIFSHQFATKPVAHIPNTIDYKNLSAYNYNTWIDQIVDSTFISLTDNPKLLESDLPFDGVQVLDDNDGNMLVFASYVDSEYEPHLRIMHLSPELRVLSPPRLHIKADLPEIDVPKGTSYRRLFWTTWARFEAEASFHQIVVTKDTVYHEKIYDR